MKRFRFPLKSLLVVREARDLRAREVFGAALQAVAAAEENLASVRREKAEFEAFMLEERRKNFRPADQAAFLQAHRRLITRETEFVSALAQAKTVAEKRRNEWMQARRDLRLIEKLEDKARTAHRLAEDREVQLQLDDRTNALVARDAVYAN